MKAAATTKEIDHGVGSTPLETRCPIKRNAPDKQSKPEATRDPEKQNELDARIRQRFQALRQEEQAQFLTYFENALRRRSLPASDCHQPVKEGR